MAFIAVDDGKLRIRPVLQGRKIALCEFGVELGRFLQNHLVIFRIDGLFVLAQLFGLVGILKQFDFPLLVYHLHPQIQHFLRAVLRNGNLQLNGLQRGVENGALVGNGLLPCILCIFGRFLLGFRSILRRLGLRLGSILGSFRPGRRIALRLFRLLRLQIVAHRDNSLLVIIGSSACLLIFNFRIHIGLHFRIFCQPVLARKRGKCLDLFPGSIHDCLAIAQHFRAQILPVTLLPCRKVAIRLVISLRLFD